MSAAVEDHDLVLRRAARQLRVAALGTPLHQHLEFAPHVAAVRRLRQFVLQGDDLRQTARLHLVGHVVGQVLRGERAGPLRIFEHVGEFVAHLAHERGAFGGRKDVDFIAICVPTPLDAHQQPDISFVRASTTEVAKYLTRETMVVLESTTYPGTTEELIKPILEEGSGLKCGKDFYLGFSPERVDPGNLIYKTKNTPKVVGAIGKDATEVIASMYRAVLEGDVYEVSSPAIAEMEKILENTYRNINIGLVNELTMLCNKMGISMWEVVDAAKTKPYGFQAFYPGPGLGGHCIPLDPYYLSWKAREYGFHTSMIELMTGCPNIV